MKDILIERFIMVDIFCGKDLMILLQIIMQHRIRWCNVAWNESFVKMIKGRFLETNLTGQLVDFPINNTKIMQYDWLLSSVSIATLDLTG
jgi:hypothetical protein